MPNGEGPPPTCDPACQKIILDGDSLMKEADVLCDALKRYTEKNGSFANPAPLIHALIKAERAVYAAHGAFLNAAGYDGERPPWIP